MPKRAAYPLLNVFRQAMGNAKTNFGISPDDLKIQKLIIGKGPRGARKADVHAHGARFDRGVRKKKLSHITLVLSYGT
jgi:ribosomal protein L22